MSCPDLLFSPLQPSVIPGKTLWIRRRGKMQKIRLLRLAPAALWEVPVDHRPNLSKDGACVSDSINDV